MRVFILSSRYCCMVSMLAVLSFNVPQRFFLLEPKVTFCPIETFPFV